MSALAGALRPARPQGAIPAWEQGVLRPVEKLDVHRRGLKHLAISVFLTRGDELLLQRRALTKYHTPGLWANACCTHPHWEEPARDCAERRLFEELGIADQPLSPRGRIEYRADVGGGLTEHELVDVFVGEADLDLEIWPNPDEVMAARWITRAALTAEIAATPESFTPWLRIYMQEHAEQIFGARA